MSSELDTLHAALADRYRIERELGEGGMATVYLAKDLKHERQVAIKLLKPELAAVMGAERFLAEIKTTANLQHPHILPLFDSGEADGVLYYVMPYVEGETLKDRLDREKQLPVVEAVQIVRKVADALQAAHDHGVIHRDIKPANILLGGGEPLVADFGIALAVTEAGGHRLTETGFSLGTPSYMSPEQATGDASVGATTDVYSLGCVLYEMLVGEPPHTGSTAQAIIGRIVAAEVAPASKQRASVPPNVDGAIARALEKVPADRFASAGAFAEALADLTFRHGQAEKLGRGMWNPLSLTTTAIAGALAVLLLVVVPFNRPRPSDGMVFRSMMDLGTISPNIGDLIVSPNGSTFAVAGTSEQGSGLYVRRANEKSFRLLEGTPDPSHPAFSLDGEWIIYRNIDSQQLLKVPVDGGPSLTVLAQGLATNPRDPQWIAEETIIFLADNGLFLVSDAGGTPQQLIEETGPLINRPKPLPGGRSVLITQSGSSVARFDIASGEITTLLTQAFDATYVDPGILVYANPTGGLFGVSFHLEPGQVTGQPIPLLDDVLLNPAQGQAYYSISSTGTLVYMSGGVGAIPDRELVIAHLNGEVEEVPLSPRAFNTPRWSPDGRFLAYESGPPGDRHIFVYDLGASAAPRQLTFDGDNRFPVWSPDGSRIAFTSHRAGTDDWDLFVVAVSGDQPEWSIAAVPGVQHPRDWPLDDTILLESGPNASATGLWQVEPTSGAEFRAYVDEADLDDIVLSPDGRWAAYQGDLTAVEEVYIQGFSTSGRRQRVTDGGGQFPRWSPDGTILYYWSREDIDADTLYAARVVTTPTFAVRSRSIVHVGAYRPEDWDLHPDGDRFVITRTASTTGEGRDGRDDQRVHVVTNWFAELREKMGN